MPVQTFETLTDADGNIRLADIVRLPGHTKVYVVVPEQITDYSQIVPTVEPLSSPTLRYPLVRVEDAGLMQRLRKTVVENADAEI